MVYGIQSDANLNNIGNSTNTHLHKYANNAINNSRQKNEYTVHTNMYTHDKMLSPSITLLVLQ